MVNRGAHSFTVLPGDGRGGFADPRRARKHVYQLSDGAVNDQPGPVVTADFHGTDGLNGLRAATADLAVLMQGRDEVWIYTNNGDGTFTLGQQIPVGRQSSGLSVIPGAGPGCSICSSGTRSATCCAWSGTATARSARGAGDRDAVSLDVLPGPGALTVLVANQRTTPSPSRCPPGTR